MPRFIDDNICPRDIIIMKTSTMKSKYRGNIVFLELFILIIKAFRGFVNFVKINIFNSVCF